MTADEVFPRVRKRLGRRFDEAGHVFGEVQNGKRRPPDVDDVNEHHRVVIRQMDIDVVGRGIGAMPRQLDALAADVQRAAVLERLFRCGPRGVVVAPQKPSCLLVPDANDFLVEER